MIFTDNRNRGWNIILGALVATTMAGCVHREAPSRFPEFRQSSVESPRVEILAEAQPAMIRPTITVIEDTESVFKDVVINVKETQTGSLLFGAGVNADAGLVSSVVPVKPLTEQRPKIEFN